MGKAIIVKDLFVSYQGNQVVQNVSLKLNKENSLELLGQMERENLL